MTEVPFIEGLILSVDAPDMWFHGIRWRCQLVRLPTKAGIEYRLDITSEEETADEWFTHEDVEATTDGDLVQYVKRLYRGRKWY